MNRLFAIFAAMMCFIIAVFSSKGATFTTATITVTNVPGVGSNFVLNGVTRTWTNAQGSPPQSWITVGANVGASATNLYNHIVRYSSFITPSLIPAFSSTNVITLRGTTVTVTTNNYSSVSYNAGGGSSNLTFVQVPFESVDGDTNRTNNADWLVGGITKYARTNAFGTNAQAMTNFLTKGASPQQTVSSPVMFALLRSTNGGLTNFYLINVSNLSGRVSFLTNGYWTNATLDRPSFTNGTLRGDFTHTGTFTGSNFTIYGVLRQDNVANASGGWFEWSADSNGGLWLSNTFTSSRDIFIDLGTDEIRFESSNIGSPGTFKLGAIITTNSASVSNLTVRGGTNIWNGDINFPWFNLTTLNNGAVTVSVPFGTNVFIRITGPTVSPTTIGGAIAGATSGGRDGQPIFIWNDSLANVVLAHGAYDPVPANCFANFGGTDVLIPPSGIALAVYAPSESRWKALLLGNTNLTASATNAISGIWTQGVAVANLATNLNLVRGAIYQLATNNSGNVSAEWVPDWTRIASTTNVANYSNSLVTVAGKSVLTNLAGNPYVAYTNVLTKTSQTVSGAGSGNTNYLITLSTNSINDFYLGSSNVNIYTVGGSTLGSPIYWNAFITNLSANTWGISFASGTNRWRFSGVYGTNAPTVLTNNTCLMLSGRCDGTNSVVGYTYFAPGQ